MSSRHQRVVSSRHPAFVLKLTDHALLSTIAPYGVIGVLFTISKRGFALYKINLKITMTAAIGELVTKYIAIGRLRNAMVTAYD